MNYYYQIASDSQYAGFQDVKIVTFLLLHAHLVSYELLLYSDAIQKAVGRRNITCHTSFLDPVLKHCLGSWLCFAISQHTQTHVPITRIDSLYVHRFGLPKKQTFSIDIPLNRDVIDDSGIETFRSFGKSKIA